MNAFRPDAVLTLRPRRSDATPALPSHRLDAASSPLWGHPRAAAALPRRYAHPEARHAAPAQV